MKICLLTPIYPSKYAAKGVTPIVHYFAKEWVRMGHKVCVFHLNTYFPKPFYLIAKMFRHRLATLFGSDVPTIVPKEYDEIVDGVEIHHLNISKQRPHSTILQKEEKRILDIILDYCKRNGNPDYFIGHWDIPQLELMPKLKALTGVLIAVTLHNNVFDYEKTHGKNVGSLFKEFDAIGFRNAASKDNFIQKYGKPNGSFMAYSGVSDAFLKAGIEHEKTLSSPVAKNFIYVGTLIKRKYPSVIVDALNEVYPQGDFKLTYIGEGAEKNTVEKIETKGDVEFTGRIPRNEIISYLKESDVFIMISRGELFGLVYLEAMALGCIPVAAKGEGIDGIIKDGYNGFLCEAGNTEELVAVIKRINLMSSEERQDISLRAKETAMQFSDANVAKSYLDDLITKRTE